MCIRDSYYLLVTFAAIYGMFISGTRAAIAVPLAGIFLFTCLLYTSDAADERSSVDLGGRRIIKKKQNYTTTHRTMLQITTVN